MKKWLVVFIAIAGCTSPSATSNEVDDDSLIRTLPFSLQSCDVLLALALKDFAAVDHLLPPGYKAADAGQFFDVDPEMGQTLVAVLIGSCDGYEDQGPIALTTGWAMVDSPDIEGGPPGEALNFFQVYSAVDSAEAQDYLNQIGWKTSLATIDLVAGDAFSQSTGTVSNSSVGLTLSALRSSVPTPLDDARTFRLWEQQGLATQLLEIAENSPGELSRGACIVEPGSLSQKVLGTSCDEFGQGLLYFPLFSVDFPGRVSVYPSLPR